MPLSCVLVAAENAVFVRPGEEPCVAPGMRHHPHQRRSRRSAGVLALSQVHTSERHYPVRRPLAAFAAGAAVALLGGLIGLGGAELRLPLLIAVFALYAHRAIRINLLISLATLATAAVARLGFIHETHVASYTLEMMAMMVGGIAAAWVGAGLLSRIPKDRIMLVIASLLAAVAVLLVVETNFAGSTALALPPDQLVRAAVALVAGIAVGSISSLLGVAGGEFIIPILMFGFGADIKTAGTASVLISTPIVVAGVARHLRTGHFRSRTMLGFLVLPMSVGSILGAVTGSYLSTWTPSDALRMALALILLASAIKLWRKSDEH